MNTNPYAAPQADLEDHSAHQAGHQPAFYVVGIRKFSILFIATLGLYVIYWFYANWKFYKARTGSDIWPAPRAIFNIFFTHALFARVQEKLDREGIEFRWSHGAVATTYVVLSLASNVLDRMSMKEIWVPQSDILSVIMVFPLFYTVLTAQKAINQAERDVQGRANDSLTWANYLWIVFGVLIWAMFALGMLVITGVLNVEQV